MSTESPSATVELPAGSRFKPALISDGVRIRRWKGHLGTAVFMACWLAGWTFACVILVNQAIANPQALQVMFAIPFVGAWFFALAILLRAALTEEELQIYPDVLVYRSGLRGQRVRRLPAGEITGMSIVDSLIEEDGTARRGVRIDTIGRPIDFATGSSDRELDWLHDYIADWFRSFGHATRPCDPVRFGWQKVQDFADAKRPSDSSYSIEPVAGRLSLRKNKPTLGEWLNAVAITILINAFWNGIVGLFAIELLDRFEWPRFIFLMPFMIIGVALIIALVVVFVLPWVVTWREFVLFGNQIEIGRRITLFGCTVKNRSQTFVDLTWPETRTRTIGRDYMLRIATADGRTAFELESVSLGEARWITRELHALSGGMWSV